MCIFHNSIQKKLLQCNLLNVSMGRVLCESHMKYLKISGTLLIFIISLLCSMICSKKFYNHFFYFTWIVYQDEQTNSCCIVAKELHIYRSPSFWEGLHGLPLSRPSVAVLKHSHKVTWLVLYHAVAISSY